MTHTTAEQRYTIFRMRQDGYTLAQIGRVIGKSPSSVCREIARNSDRRDGKYKPEQAQRKADRRKALKPHYHKLSEEMMAVIIDRLNKDWSPEEISGRCRFEGIDMVSHETIYQFIYTDKQHGGNLYKKLRRKGHRYQHRGSEYRRRGIIPGRVDISSRPAIVEEKRRFGDLEIDTVIGRNHKGALLTINDRVTSLAWIRKLEGKSAVPFAEATIRALASFKDIIHTITSDNGKEFANHGEIACNLGIDFYFCRPYHSWERGANENMNGLIRQYIPKKTDMTEADEDLIRKIQDKLNNRPRKRLGWLTPIEMFNKLTGLDFVALVT